MKPLLYILLLKNNQYYIGSTTNLPRRIAEHHRKNKSGTKYQAVQSIVFTQKFDTYSEARKAEIKLKKFKSKKIIEKIISDGKIIKI